ncbi:MAG: tetratricopeptide repeat protein [Methanospirillum sp.]|nr:tetratricopeptide repeat protein [Methanospirillum sp.]
MNIRILFINLILVGFFIPAGVLASDDGWSHGSLFSAPNWLLEQFDDESKELSQMDYFGIKLQEPTPVPPTAMDLVNEGWIFLEKGNNKDALKSFEKALAINSASTEAWYGRGLALENQKRYLSAIDAYSKAVSFSKKSASSWGPNAGKGRSCLALNQFENAKEAITLAISQYEQSGEDLPDELVSMYLDLAQVYEMLGDYDAAQETLEKTK